MKDRRLLMIRWTDAHSAGEWRRLDDAVWTEAPGDIWTVGWLIDEAETHITVASSVAEDGGQACGDMTIPRGAIQEVREIGGEEG